MKVKDLIKELKKYDKDNEVFIEIPFVEGHIEYSNDYSISINCENEVFISISEIEGI